MTAINEFSSQVDEAIALRNAGDVNGAREILAGILSATKKCPSAYVVLGGIQWDAGESDNALASFRAATRLDPTMEMASLPLFHILMEIGLVDEAFSEARRFLAVADSQEYSRLIWELNHTV